MENLQKILVVDDDLQILDLLHSILTKKGYQCLLASNTTEARKLLREGVDIVLCDIMMPEESGIDFCRSIRSQAPDTAVLMVTGLDDPGTINQAIEAGADGYITKPVEPHTLLPQIAKAIYHRKHELAAERYKNKLETSVEKKTESLKRIIRKLAEERRRHKEKVEFLYKLFNTVQAGVILVDADTQKISEVNDHACKLIGAPRESLIGKTCYETICPANSGECPVKDSGGRVCNTERILLKANGEKIPILKSVEPVELDGKLFYIDSFVDLRERKKLELDLLAKEKKLTAIAESAQDAIVMLDDAGKISFWNERASKMFQYTKAEALGKDLHELLAPPRYLDHFRKAFPQFRRTGSGNAVGKTLELTALRKDGAEFPIELSLSSLQLNGKWHAVGIIRDITERKLIIEALRESEEQFRVAIENSNDGIALLRETKHFYVNKKYLEILGYEKPEELIGKPISAIIHPDDRDKVYRFNKARREGKPAPSRYEARMIRRDAEIRHVEISATLTKYRGEPLILANIRDITERKRIEEELIKNEQFLKDMFNAIQDGISVLNTDLTIQKVNSKMEDWYARSVPLEGKKCYEAYHNRHKPCNKCPSLRAFVSGNTEREIVPGLAGSSVEWVELFSYPIFDSYGEVTGVVEFVRDITEVKRAENALRESEEKYRLLVENLKEGVLVEQDGNLKFTNPAIRRITGYSKEELHTMPWIDIVHPEDKEMAIRNHTNRLKGKNVPDTYLLRIINKQGEVRWLENSAVGIEWEGRPASLNFLTDVTERKLAEDEFRRAHAELEDLIKSISSILIELSPDGIIRRWNKIAQDVFGLNEEQARGKKLDQLPIDWQFKKISEGLENCKASKTPIRLQDIPFQRQDNTRGFLGLTITPKLGETRELKGFIIMASDITERRNLETQLLQAQKLESVGQLAAGIAHEINTPIQFVGDNIQFIQESFDDLTKLLKAYKALGDTIATKSEESVLWAEKAKQIEDEIDLEYLMEEIPKAIEQSMEGVRRVAKIVRAMKEFSHPGVQEKTPIDINHAIENTSTVARNEWKYVADLELDLDPSLPPVPCLPGEFNQVILNMIINAAHAISDVIQGKEGKGKITITTKRKEHEVEIRISDTGTGIPEKIRDRIFDPFFTTKQVGKGTGQGLAISRSVIVDKHGGTIRVESEVGKGTTFIITLPIQEGIKM